MRRTYPLGLILALVGLAALAVLLTLASSGSVTAQIVTAIPTFTPTATIGPTPIITPTPAGCGGALPLVKGSIIFIKPGINIRNLPSLDGGVVGYTAESMTFSVTGGPVCANDFNWWQITGPGNPGWVAEGRPGEYFIFDSGFTISGTQTAPCGDRAVYVPGERIVLFKGVRVRENPGIGNLVITVAATGMQAVVLNGPVCADSYWWWKVRVVVVGVTYDGWIVQGTRGSTENYAISEAELNREVCSWPLMLHIGDNAYVNYYDFVPKHLRSEPGLEATILLKLLDNVPVTILDGPVCADGYNWWKVTIRSNIPMTGWMAEGGNWIKTISPPVTSTPFP